MVKPRKIWFFSRVIATVDLFKKKKKNSTYEIEYMSAEAAENDKL